MNSKHATLLGIGILALLAETAAQAQPSGVPRIGTMAPAASAAPTVTILTAAAGALIRSQGAGNASLDLGRVSYFKGTSAPGQASEKRTRSFVISTRFALRVDCPGSPPASKVNVTMSRLDAAPSHAIAIDGNPVSTTERTLEQSMPCGSAGEHRLEVEVPVSTPAGSIGSNIAFVATLKK